MQLWWQQQPLASSSSAAGDTAHCSHCQQQQTGVLTLVSQPSTKAMAIAPATVGHASCYIQCGNALQVRLDASCCMQRGYCLLLYLFIYLLLRATFVAACMLWLTVLLCHMHAVVQFASCCIMMLCM